MFGSGRVGGVGGEWVTRLGLGLTNSGRTLGEWDIWMCIGCGGVGGIGGEWVGDLVQDLGGWGGVMYVCVVSLESLCRWQVHVSVYCAKLHPVHLMCTHCSIMLHIIDICFLTCICLWQISQIQTFLCVVVGPGLDSTSSAFMRSIASHPASPPCRLAKKTEIGPPLLGAGGVDTLCTGFARPQ